ncbi:MAG: hypothetical protein ACT4QC_16525 [Planctomycetaceae bacterium]
MRLLIAKPRAGKATTVALLSIVILAAAGWAAWSAFGRSGPGLPPDDGRTIVEPFLDEVRGGKASHAWESTAAEFKSAMGRETFLRYVKGKPSLKQPAQFVSVQEVSVNGLPRTECAYRVDSPASGKGTVRVLLARERGDWKVERLIVE